MPDTSMKKPAAAKSGGFLSVGAVARRSGLSVSAIHFYERQGLIRADRNAANHRRYPRSALRVLAVIKVGQGAGIPLAEIRRVLGTAADGDALSVADWTAISQAWRDDLNARIGALERIRDRLDGCIGCGCLSLSTCAAVNPGDRAAAAGPGAIGLDGRTD